MASSIINYIVEKYLANFLEINPDETKASLWSGTFEMNNVKIKEEIFQTLNLPYLQLLNGYVGKLTITLALPRFYLYPIKIELDKVFFHAKQKNLDKLNSNEEFISIEAFKDSQLLNVEELQAEVTKFNNEAPGMVAQVINNLQISINDICIRFDDDISHPRIPFSFGVIIKQMLLHTTNANYDDDLSKYTSNVEFGEINYKLIKMSNVNIYLDTFNDSSQCDFSHYISNEARSKIDQNASLVKYLGKAKDFYTYCISEVDYNINENNSHEYMLYQLTMALKISMNENLQNGKAKMSVLCELNKVQTSFSFEQIAVVIKLLQYIQLNSLYRIGVSKKFYKKQLGNEDKIKYMTRYIEYYKWKYQKSNLIEAEKERIVLKQYECGLTYDQIQSMRQACLIKIEYIKSLDNIDAEIQKKEAAKGSSWNPMNYWSSGPTEEEKKELELLMSQKENLVKTEADLDKKMNEHLMTHNNKAEEVDQLQGLKSDFILYDFKLTMPKCIMTIFERRGVHCIDIIHEGFNVKCFIMKQGQFFSLTINTISITQAKLAQTPYDTLMKTIESQGEESNINRSYPYSAFYIEFENNPKLEKSNYRLMFRNDKQLGITLNLYTIQFFINNLLDCLMSNSISVSDLSNYAQKEVTTYIESGKITEQLSGNTQHFNIALDIFIKGPIVILPQNILDASNRKCLLIESGSLRITSSLPQRQDFVNNDYTTLANRKEMFDLYMVKGDDFFLGTINNFNGDFAELREWDDQKKNSMERLDIIDNVKLKVDAETMIEPRNQLFEDMNLSIDFETIGITLRDSQLIFMIELLKGNNMISKRLKVENDKEKLKKGRKKGKGKGKRHKMIEEDNKDEEIIPVKKDNEGDGNDEDEFEDAVDEEIISDNNKKEEEEIANDKDEEIILVKAIEDDKKAEIKDKISFIMHYKISELTFNLMKSLSAKELKSHPNSDNLPFINKYKQYITFELKSFEYHLLTSLKGNLTFEANINQYTLTDHLIHHPSHREMFAITFNQLSNIKIIKPDSVNLDEKPKSSFFNKSIISDIEMKMMDNSGISRLSSKEKKLIFINFVYAYNSLTQQSNISLNMNNMQMCILLPSVLELWLFYNYYYNNYLRMCNTDTAPANEEECKEMTQEEFMEYQYEHQDNDDDGKEGAVVNHNWMTAVKYAQRGNFIKKNSTKLGNFMKVIHKRVAEKKEHVKSKTAIEIKFNNLKMLFPLSETSKEVVEYNYCMLSNINLASEYEMILDSIKNKTLRIDYISKTMSLNVKLYQLELDIKHTNDNLQAKQSNKSTESLLTNYRMEIAMNTFLIPKEEKNITSISIHLEPLSLLLGFKEINVLKAYGLAMSQFSTDMYKKKYNDPMETYNTFKTRSKKTGLGLGNKDEDENDVKQAKLLKNQINAKINHQAKKIIKLTEYNTTSFNSIIDVTIAIDKINLKLFDNQRVFDGRFRSNSQNQARRPSQNQSQGQGNNDQLYQEVPLLNIEINQINLHYLTNSLPYDIDNMSLALMEMIARSEIPIEKYNIFSLYQFTLFEMLYEIKVFNPNISEWEPLLEPYSLTIKLSQVDPLTPYALHVTSPDMLNMNISTSSLKVINTILKLLNTEVSDAVINNDYRDDATVVRFMNKIGLNASISFLATPNEAFTLKALDSSQESSKEFKQSEMETIHKHLKTREAQLLMKDKITLKINGYYTIDMIDYSYNQFTAYRIKAAGSNGLNGNEDLALLPNENKHIEIGIRVKDSGLTRTVIINSTLAIVNMTKYDLMLYAVKKSDFKEKYEGNAERIEFDKMEGVKFNKLKRTYLPIQWTIDHDDTMIFGNVIGCNKRVMLYEDLKWLDRMELEEESKDTIASYGDDYAKMIQFDNGDNEGSVLLNFDVVVMKGKEEMFIESNELEMQKEKEKYIVSQLQEFSKTKAFSIRIRAPVLFTNDLPFPLTINYNNDNQDDKTLMNPLDKQNHYHNIAKPFSLSIQINDTIFQSSLTSLIALSPPPSDQPNHIIPIQLCDMKNNTNTLNCNINILHHTIPSEDYTKAIKDFKMEIVNYSSKTLKVQFFFDYLIINKTDLSLHLADSSNPKDTSLVIEPSMIKPYNPKPKSKIVMKTETSDWISKFNPATFGMTGVKNFIEKTGNDWLSKDVAIIIASSTVFANTMLLTIEPRYIIENCLGIDVCFCQSYPGFDCNREKIKLEKEAMKPMYYYISEGKFNKKFKPEFEIVFKDEHSSGFHVNSIDEIDIKIPYKEDENDDETYIPERCIYEINGKSYMMIRVTVHTKDNGMVYVLLSFPEYPLYAISNKTEEEVVVYQPLKAKVKTDKKKKGVMIEDEEMEKRSDRLCLGKDMTIPFIFEEYNENNSAVIVQFSNDLKKEISLANLDQIKVPSKEPKYILTVDIDKNRHTRLLTITNNTFIETKKDIIKVMTGKKKYTEVKTFVSLKGVGLSLFNSSQQELLYISLYGIDIKQLSNVSLHKNSKDNTETLSNLIVYLKNFQIDYCLNGSFMNILVPKAQLIPANEVKRIDEDDEIVPFVQLLITKNTIVNNKNKYDDPIVKYSQIDFLMQEMNLNIEQKAMLNVLQAFNDLTSEMDYIFPKQPAGKDMIIIEDQGLKKLKTLKEIDPALDITIESGRNVLTEDNVNMMINYFMLSSIKINMTVRVNINEYIDFLPKPLVKIIGSLGNSIARISDFPLRFSEIMIENVFASSSKMSGLLYKHYERQAMIEVCKLLGSSDLIGNPVGFVNKIGTGFIEFYNEPRKGFVKGPLHFTRGLARGFASLIGNIVGGSFQMVGNITGSLLTVAKVLQGEKVSIIEDNEPEDIIDGLYEGLKGGGMELINGITGIFLHPYRKAKEEGIVGFFKGLGIGLFNSVISPFAAVFHLGNAVFMGLKNTTNILMRNKIKTTRFRQPRDTVKAKALEVYNEDYAEVRALIRMLRPKYSNEKLIYYKDFYIADFKYEAEISTVILTEEHLMIVYNNEEIVMDIENRSITKTELYNLNKSFSLIVTYGLENKIEYFYTDNELLCREIYSLLELIRKK